VKDEPDLGEEGQKDNSGDGNYKTGSQFSSTFRKARLNPCLPRLEP